MWPNGDEDESEGKVCLVGKNVPFAKGKKDASKKKNYCFMVNKVSKPSIIEQVNNMLKFKNGCTDNCRKKLKDIKLIIADALSAYITSRSRKMSYVLRRYFC